MHFKTYLEQAYAIMGHSLLFVVNLGFCLVILNDFLGLFCRRDKDLAFCKSARQLSDEQLASLSLVQQECCLFVFLDGSAHFFDDFLKVVIYVPFKLSKYNI